MDFERDLTVQRDTLATMTATMACRGPDAEGVWVDQHALLGHRRLAVIDLDGGVQPMRSVTRTRTGAPAAVLTFSGEVYNFRELRTELAARGHRFATVSDTEVVLTAYLEWGEGFVEHLNGMYGFALWDTRSEALLLVRDRLGVKPLYYRPTTHGMLFGSEPKAILAHPSVDAVVDLDGLRELFALAKTPGHGVYQGVYEVRPGHLLRVSREGHTEREYWRLPTRDHVDDLPTTVGTVRDLLHDTVQRQLVSDVPRCTLLSGGLDSSAITAIAAGQLAADDAGPLASFAVDFAGPDAATGADPAAGFSPDRPYAHAVAAHTNTVHTDIVLPVADLADPLHRTTALVARDLPIGRGERDTSLYLLFRAVRQHSTVALSGESADELFGGYGWFHDPATVGSDGFPWIAENGPGFADTLDRLLAPDLSQALDLPGYRRERHREALADVDHLPGVTDPHERRMREVGHLALTRFLPRLLERKDRMSMATGLEARVPFCDHRLVGYVYNTPWAMKTHDGREKSLLRAATRDLLPASVVERPKSPYPSTPHLSYTRAIRDQFDALAADPAEPVHALLDPKWVLATREGHPTASDSGDPALDDYLARFGMETALLINGWLRRVSVRLAV